MPLALLLGRAKNLQTPATSGVTGVSKRLRLTSSTHDEVERGSTPACFRLVSPGRFHVVSSSSAHAHAGKATSPPADLDRVVLLTTWATRPRSRIDSLRRSRS